MNTNKLNSLSACDKFELKEAIKTIGEIRKTLIEIKPREKDFKTYKQYQLAYRQWCSGYKALYNATQDVAHSKS